MPEEDFGIDRQRRVHFLRQRHGLRGGPLRHQARVHQQLAMHRIVVGERALQQPLQQRHAIGGAQDFAQRVAGFVAQVRAIGPGEQVQVMIAQHYHGVVAQGADQPQAGEGFRTAVDEVAHEPQLVAVG